MIEITCGEKFTAFRIEKWWHSTRYLKRDGSWVALYSADTFNSLREILSVIHKSAKLEKKSVRKVFKSQIYLFNEIHWGYVPKDLFYRFV